MDPGGLSQQFAGRLFGGFLRTVSISGAPLMCSGSLMHFPQQLVPFSSHGVPALILWMEWKRNEPLWQCQHSWGSRVLTHILSLFPRLWLQSSLLSLNYSAHSNASKRIRTYIISKLVMDLLWKPGLPERLSAMGLRQCSPGVPRPQEKGFRVGSQATSGSKPGLPIT